MEYMKNAIRIMYEFADRKLKFTCSSFPPRNVIHYNWNYIKKYISSI